MRHAADDAATRGLVQRNRYKTEATSDVRWFYGLFACVLLWFVIAVMFVGLYIASLSTLRDECSLSSSSSSSGNDQTGPACGLQDLNIQCIDPDWASETGVYCDVCRAGFATASINGTQAKCTILCGQGAEPVAHNHCVLCQPGKYADSYSSTDACRECPLGYIALGFGEIACIPCHNGTHAINTTTPCEPCPENTTTPYGPGTTVCTPTADNFTL